MGTMRENAKVRERLGALGGARAWLAIGGALALLGAVFVLGLSTGKRAAAKAPAAPEPHEAISRLDEPLAAKEDPPELKAHGALSSSRPIDKALPVAPARTDPDAVEVAATPPQIPADASAAPAPKPALPLDAVDSKVAPAASASASTDPTSASTRTATASGSRTGTKAETRTPARAGTPARPAAPARAGAAPARHAYTIQVASSPRRADAERTAKKLSARHPRIVAADLPGKGRWYRVQIGSYPSREAARRQLASLSRVGVQGVVTAVR
jgi:septal ring-binding cell division protein DamX